MAGPGAVLWVECWMLVCPPLNEATGLPALMVLLQIPLAVAHSALITPSLSINISITWTCPTEVLVLVLNDCAMQCIVGRQVTDSHCLLKAYNTGRRLAARKLLGASPVQVGEVWGVAAPPSSWALEEA